MEIRVKARLSFPALAKATSVNNGPEKFRARLIFDPDAAWGKSSIKLIRETRLAVAVEKWKSKSKAQAILDTIKGDRNKETWFESDYRSQEGEVYAGFEGMYHLSCLSDLQPLLLDADLSEVSARKFYSGCYVVAKVDIFAQDNQHGKGMRAQVMGVQFWKDGEGFGGGKRASVDDFEALSDTGEDDEDEAPKSRKSRDEDEAPRKASAKRRAPVDEDEDEIA